MFLKKLFGSRLDLIILVSISIIFLSSLITINSFGTGDSHFIKQSIWIVISFLVIYFLSSFDYRFLKQTRVVVLLYAIFLFILSLLFILGHISKGAQSWFSFGQLAFQPTDFMKLVLIVVLAKYFSRRHIEIANIRHIIVSAVYTLIPFLLILMQPDFGSAMIIFLIWLGMVLVSGISKKHLFLVFLIGTVIFLVSWRLLFKPYQKARIMNFIYPLRDIRGTGYNAFQATIAVGSGGLLGKGAGYGTQSRLNFLPEYRTDFVFAAFAEEWGFLGTIFLFVFYFLILYRLAVFANLAESNFESLFNYGVMVWFFSHIIINIGMNIGVMPVTGIPLPFMSYGGSHILAECVALGVCMGMNKYGRAVHRNQMKNEFLGL